MSIPNLTRLSTPILEKTTPEISFTIADADGVAIPLVSLASLTLDLYVYDGDTFPAIGARTNQNVLNANDVIVDAQGGGIWTLDTVDTAIVDSTLDIERHRAEFAYTYGAPVKTGRHVIEMRIVNLKKV